MIKLLRWASRTVAVLLLGLFARHFFAGDEITRYFWLLVVLLIVAAVVAVLMLEPVMRFLTRGPRLVGGQFVEIKRDAIGGPDLQVLGVEIYNERESGGESKTARDVVPSIAAYTLDRKLVTENRGVWFPDAQGVVPETVTFRPTREKHPIELAGKFPNSSHAWLAGQHDPPSLAPGVYEIRVTLRGDNLRTPARLRFFLRNPGASGRLSAARRSTELEPVEAAQVPDARPTSHESPEEEPVPPEEENGTVEDALPVDPVARVDALIAQAEELDTALWERVKRLRRSGSPLPSLGNDYLQELKAWNEEVLALADEFLPLRDAAQVDALAGWTSVFATSDRVGGLIRNNLSTLQDVRWRAEAQQKKDTPTPESA